MKKLIPFLLLAYLGFAIGHLHAGTTGLYVNNLTGQLIAGPYGAGTTPGFIVQSGQTVELASGSTIKADAGSTITGFPGAPSGATNTFQYNSGGSFAGTSGFTWSATNGMIDVQTLTNFPTLFTVQNLSTGTSAGVGMGVANSSGGLQMEISSTAYSGSIAGTGPTGQATALISQGNIPLVFGVNGAAAMYLDASQNINYFYGKAISVTDSGGTARRFLMNNTNVYDVGDIDGVGYALSLLAGSSAHINFVANSSIVGYVSTTGLNSVAIGATTASTGAFTTLSASGTSALTGNVGIGQASNAAIVLGIGGSTSGNGAVGAQFNSNFTTSGNSQGGFGLYVGGSITMAANTGTGYNSIYVATPSIVSGTLANGYMLQLAAPATGMTGGFLNNGSSNLVGTTTIGNASALAIENVNGTNSGTAGGAYLNIENNGTSILALGNTSALTGGSYSAVALIQSSNNLVFETNGTTTVLTLTSSGSTFGGQETVADADLRRTTTTLTNGAASSAGTLTNAPAVGNPTKWAPVNDNGTTRYVPMW